MVQNEINKLIEPLLNDLGYELWGCEYLSQGKHSLLRIYIDKLGGVNINDCGFVSKQIGSLLDVENIITQDYTLEVSSPGIPRPLFKKEQYARYLGKNIIVKLKTPLQNKRNFTGSLITVDDSSLILQTEGEQIQLPFSQIMKATLVSEESNG